LPQAALRLIQGEQLNVMDMAITLVNFFDAAATARDIAELNVAAGIAMQTLDVLLQTL
jgi:hypothetical protein